MSTFTVLNPATEEPVTTLTQASSDEADHAIARASAALPAWRAVSPGTAPGCCARSPRPWTPRPRNWPGSR